MAPIVETHNLGKVYRAGREEIRAVDQLSLTVEKGECFCLVGPNGAGKTTTVKLLITLTRPTAGTAKVCGYDVQANPAQVRHSIGYTSQEIIADELLSGRENLSLIARLQGVARGELGQRVQNLLAMFELAEWADRLVKTYSGGMRKKLDIAGALIHTPPLLFLDEPTLGLDPQARHAIWDYLVRLNREQQITVFMTTHYLDEADALAHRLAIMDEGRIVALDTPDALKRRIGGHNLDDVFLHLTGRPLREGGAQPAWVARARTRA